MSDTIRSYLKEKGYAEYIIEGGLEYLIIAWEDVVEKLVDGAVPPYQGYLNDMHRRRILQEAIAAAPTGQQEDYAIRLFEIDSYLLPHLIPTTSCICGMEEALIHDYSPHGHWWYFHRPKAVDETWPASLRA